MSTETSSPDLTPPLEPDADPLDLAGALADDERDHPDRAVTEEQILSKLRNKMFNNIDTYTPKEQLQIYLAAARLEEARLKVSSKTKTKDAGSAELRAKAARAIRGGGAPLVDEEGDDDDD